MPFHRQKTFQIGKLLFDPGQHAAVAVDEPTPLGIQLELLQPSPAFLAKQIVVGGHDQPLRQHRVHAVLDGHAVADQAGPPAGPAAQLLRGCVGLPHARQKVAAQQLGQHVGIDLVGLDLGLGDGFGLHWIADHDLGHARPQRLDHRPGVGGRLQNDPVGRQQTQPSSVGTGRSDVARRPGPPRPRRRLRSRACGRPNQRSVSWSYSWQDRGPDARTRRAAGRLVFETVFPSRQ
jgi:hypothetical protein